MRLFSMGVIVGTLLVPAVLDGQNTLSDPPRRLDAELLQLTASWVWSISDSWAFGAEIGAGALEQKTFAPSGDDFTASAHVGVVSATRLSDRVSTELGARVGLGELRSRSCSGCLPDPYGGLAAGLFGGGRRFQIGTRLTTGLIGGETFLAWSPLALRIRF